MTLTTNEIQSVIIALINYRPGRVITAEELDDLIAKFSAMNKACTESNNYTLTVLLHADHLDK